MQLTEGAQYSIIANQLCVGACQLHNQIQERVRIYNPFTVETNVAIFLTQNTTSSVEQLLDQLVGDSVAKVQAFIQKC